MTARPSPEHAGSEGRERLDPGVRHFLETLCLAKNWASLKIFGGMTDSERRDRQTARKLGLAEYYSGLWRITDLGRAALRRAELPANREG